MKKILSIVNGFFSEISGWLLCVITFLLVLNLITRSFGVAVQGLLELSTAIFIAVIYLGIGHCEEVNGHIKVDFVLQRVPQKLRDALNIFNYLLAIIIGSLIAYAAFISAEASFLSNETVPGTAPLPVAPVRFIIFIGVVAFVLQVVLHLYTVLKRNAPNNRSKVDSE